MTTEHFNFETSGIPHTLNTLTDAVLALEGATTGEFGIPLDTWDPMDRSDIAELRALAARIVAVTTT